MAEISLAQLLTTPCAQRAGKIGPVLVTRQPSVTLYTFTLDAATYQELCRVERFGESEGGVQRVFKEQRAWDIAEYMLQPDAMFAENPLGALEGDWRLEEGYLHYGVGAYITLDDGQHRRGALELINPEEGNRWEFIITVTKGASYNQRLMAFMQQTKMQRIDARLLLAQQAELGQWSNPAQARAYALCKELAHDPRSPLKGLIIMGEQDKRPYEGRHRPVGINVKGLHLTFTSLMNPKSPLSKLSDEKQLEVIKNLIRAASHVWKHAWRSERHILTTARGINAVCKLVVGGRSFQAAVGVDFSYEHIAEIFGLASKFDWGAKKATNETERSIMDRLDTSIGRALQRAQLADSDEIVV